MFFADHNVTANACFTLAIYQALFHTLTFRILAAPYELRCCIFPQGGWYTCARLIMVLSVKLSINKDIL
jgi:hypothetical protein